MYRIKKRSASLQGRADLFDVTCAKISPENKKRDVIKADNITLVLGQINKRQIIHGER